MKYYIDCEFNGFGGELISLAIVSENDRSLYLINESFNSKINPWVKENVMPILYSCPIVPIKVKREMFSFIIKGFLEEDINLMTLEDEFDIYVDWPDDIKYFCECLITGPGNMISLYHSMNFHLRRVDSYPNDVVESVQHNAWWDAMMLKKRIESQI